MPDTAPAATAPADPVMDAPTRIKSAWMLGFNTYFINTTDPARKKAAGFCKWAAERQEKRFSRMQAVKDTIRSSVKSAAAEAKGTVAATAGAAKGW